MTGLIVAAQIVSLLAGQVDTPHLSALPSSTITKAGLDLHLDVRTRAVWHVYAKGNPGYHSLALEIDAPNGRGPRKRGATRR